MLYRYQLKLDNIKYLHFYMALIIVMYHVGVIMDGKSSKMDMYLTIQLSNLFEFLANIAMSYFFFVSGYLLFKTLEIFNYVDKVKRRLKTLLAPYIGWNLIVFLMKCIVGKESIFSAGKMFDIRYYPPDGPLWYMYCIFLLALISPIFLSVVRKNNIFIIALFSICCNFLLHRFSFNDGYAVNLLHFFPIWLLGGVISKNDMNRKKLIALIMVTCFSFKGGIYNYLLFIVQIIIILLLLSLKIEDEKKNTHIYKWNFLIYVIHGPIIEVGGRYVKTLFMYLCGSTFISSVLCKLFFTCCCLLLCWLFYFVFRKHKTVIKVLTCNRG